MVGLVFSKLSRPRNRSKTIIFSNHATITMRNRKLCLIIRIGDLREDNFILDTQAGNDRRGVTIIQMFRFLSRSSGDRSASRGRCTKT